MISRCDLGITMLMAGWLELWDDDIVVAGLVFFMVVDILRMWWLINERGFVDPPDRLTSRMGEGSVLEANKQCTKQSVSP